MSKLIPMEQAATMLGMSVEQINELRSNQEIFGYKDGGTWKFKMTELERVADNLGVSLGGVGDVAGAVTGKVKEVADSFDDLDFGDSEELLLDDDSSSSLDLDIDEESSVELLQSKKSSDIFSDLDDDVVTLEDSGLLASGTSKDDSLVIGNSGEIDLGESGSLKLKDESSLRLGESGVLDLGTGSEVLDDDDQLSFGSSDISLASGSSKKLGAADTGSDVLDGEAATSGSPSDTGKMLGEDASDDLLLAEDDLFEDDLVLQDSASFEDSSDLGSDFEESDLILDDSDSSSELALEANQSGISLSANESGISLGDEPLELGGSDIDELELPGDDDMIVLEDAADPDAATMMQEDDFNLTPLEQSLDGEDSSGSSSQVIALEDSEIYADESEATILADDDGFSAPALVDDGFGMAEAGMVGAGVAAGAMIPGMAMEGGMVHAGPSGPPEAEYSIMNVMALSLTMLILFLGALLAFDSCRNLWVGDGQVVSSGFLNMVIDAFGMKNN